MGRPPCCNKEEVKKGAWTPEEDKILVDYINKNGHGTWRSLPKLAGLSFLDSCPNVFHLHYSCRHQGSKMFLQAILFLFLFCFGFCFCFNFVSALLAWDVIHNQLLVHIFKMSQFMHCLS